MAKLKQFALDSLSNYFNMFMKIGIYFISVPICLDAYGKELYGVFLLTFGLANSFMFFDFGIANFLIRYASAYKRTKDIKQFSEEILFSLSTLFYSIVLSFEAIASRRPFCTGYFVDNQEFIAKGLKDEGLAKGCRNLEIEKQFEKAIEELIVFYSDEAKQKELVKRQKKSIYGLSGERIKRLIC